MESINEIIKNAQERYEQLKDKKNDKYEIKDGKIFLKKGTLIHGMKYNEEKLKNIAKVGLLGQEASGYLNPGSGAKFSKGVCFYRVPDNMTMDEYVQFYSNRKYLENGEYKEIKSEEEIVKEDGYDRILGKTPRRAECEFLPCNDVVDNCSLAFIINMNPEMEKIINEDPYQKENKDIFDNYYGFDKKFAKMKDRIGTIVYGIPTSQITGIYVPKNFGIGLHGMKSTRTENLEFLKNTFPDLFICTTNGELLYEPQRENNFDKIQELRTQMEWYSNGQSLLTVTEIHQKCKKLGLEFKKEMQQAREKAKFKGDLDKYLKFPLISEKNELTKRAQNLNLVFDDELHLAYERKELREEMRKYFNEESKMSYMEIDQKCTELGINYNFEMTKIRDQEKLKKELKQILEESTSKKINETTNEIKENYTEYMHSEEIEKKENIFGDD